MNNPYEILGVSKNASNEEIKQAYKQIARKYHSDNFTNSPISDIAEEKMKELNEAYDAIIAQRSNNSSDYNSASSQNEQSYFGGATQYPDVRKHIDNGRYEDALMVLEGIQSEYRTAEWYYLKGVIQKNQGWIEEAYNNLKIATDMDPYNGEYAKTFDDLSNVLNAQNNYYGFGRNNRSTRRNRSDCGCDPCNICMGLFCLDSFCDCFDGDFCCCC